MPEGEKAYWISEVADLLDMNVNTLRKYCLLLEENGYPIKRDDQNRRAFLQNDIILLQEINRARRTDKMPLEEAVKVAISRSSLPVERDISTAVMPGITEQNPIILQLHGTMQELAVSVTDLKQEVHLQRQELQDQRTYIANLEEKRIKQMDEFLTQWTERYREIKAEEEKQKNEKRGFWSRLFGR